jgi:hypothetical protein
MPTIYPSRRFSRQKDILHSKCDASSKSTLRECIFLPVVPTSTLGIRFERALVLLLFGEDDFGARSIQSSSSPESSSSCCARLVVVRRISLFVFFFFFFGKKLDYSFSFRPFCFGETKRRRDLFDSLSLSQKSSSSRRGFFFKGGLLLLSRSSSSFTSSSSSANKKKDVLLASSGVFEGGRRCSSARGVLLMQSDFEDVSETQCPFFFFWHFFFVRSVCLILFRSTVLLPCVYSIVLFPFF